MDHQILIDAEVAVPQGLEEGLRRVITAALAAEGGALPCEISVLLPTMRASARSTPTCGTLTGPPTCCPSPCSS